MSAPERTGERLTVEGVEYMVVHQLVTASTAEPNALHLHLGVAYRPAPGAAGMSDSPVPPTSLGEAMARELRRALLEAGLSQAQAARLLRTSPKHLNQVLMARAGADHRTLDRWARRLGYRWVARLERVRDHP